VQKNGEFMGQLIWVRGMLGMGIEEAMQSLWFSCDTRAGGVWVFSPQKLAQWMASSAGDLKRNKFEVIVLKDFEMLTGNAAARCLSAIERFCFVFSGVGVRLVLWSEGEISSEMMGIHRLSPLMVRFPESDADPLSLNSRIHGLIDEASRITEVPIKRLSEKAAHFLEETYLSYNGDEFLILLVEGIRRSDGRTLRFRDLLPNFSHYFDSDDPLETYCN
jgi:hypothetical protein